MALSPVSVSQAYQHDPVGISKHSRGNVPFGSQSSRSVSPTQPPCVKCTATSEYYSSESLYLEYESKDGDKVSLSWQQVEYQKTSAQINASGDKDEKWEKIVDNIKKELLSVKKDLIKQLLKGENDKDGKGGKVPGLEGTTDEDDVAEVPEYWNAENTSQRIVDFAVSFSGLFEGGDEKFAEMMKQAIEEGFKQAREMMGEVPSSVSHLIDKTYDLTMKKIDAWLEGRKGSPEQETPAVA